MKGNNPIKIKTSKRFEYHFVKEDIQGLIKPMKRFLPSLDGRERQIKVTHLLKWLKTFKKLKLPNGY